MSRSGVTSPAIDGHAPTAAALASRSLCAIHLLIASSLLSDQPSLCEGCLVRGTIPRSRASGLHVRRGGEIRMLRRNYNDRSGSLASNRLARDAGEMSALVRKRPFAIKLQI